MTSTQIKARLKSNLSTVLDFNVQSCGDHRFFTISFERNIRNNLAMTFAIKNSGFKKVESYHNLIQIDTI